MGIGAGKLVDTLLSEPVEAYEDYFRVYFQAPSAEEIAAGLDPFFDEEDDFGPMLFDPEDVGPFSLFGASPDDVPFRRPRDLPGRNDPCWCGSGHKYKHCHWKEDLGDTS